MLFLLFKIGDADYAFAADRIVEVLPLVGLKAVRHAPAGIAGSFDYRGRFVPVVDLRMMELGEPSRPLLSTRIVMMRYPDDGSGLLGAIVEKATETLRCEAEDFAPFASSARGLVQRIELDALLAPDARDYLLGELAEIA
jgi:chemotaxis-related protein WspB